MKKFILIILMTSLAAASSPTVILTSDKTELMVNESIKFHIEVHDWGSSAGGFTIMREVEVNKFKIVGRPYFTSSCTMCRKGKEHSDLDENFIFKPTVGGNYRAEASYATAYEKIDFTVYSPTTTTSSTSTSTSTTSSTSSTTSTTSSTTSTTSTSSTSTSTTIPASPGGEHLTAFHVLGLVLLLFVSALVYKKIRCS
jgi:hypothetical protein